MAGSFQRARLALIVTVMVTSSFSLQALGMSSGAEMTPNPATNKAASIESLLPDGTLFLIGIDDLKALIRSLDGMPLGKIINDEEVSSFLEEPIKALNAMIEQGMKEVREEEVTEGVEIDPSKILNTSYGRVFCALTHVTLPKNPDGEGLDIGLVIGLEPLEGTTDPIELARMLGRKAADKYGEAKVTDGEHAGVRYTTIEEVTERVGPKPIACFTKVGSVSVFATSLQAMKAVIDRSKGQGAPLQASKNYSQVAQNIDTSFGGSRLFLDLQNIMGLFLGAANLGKEWEPDEPFFQKAEAILDATGLRSLLSYGLSFTSKDGIGKNRSYLGIADKLSKLAAVSPPVPVDLQKLKWIPKNSLGCRLNNWDLAAVYDSIMEAMKIADERTYAEVEGTMKGLSAAVSGEDGAFDFRRDFLGSLGTEYISFQTAAQGFTSSGHMVFMLAAKDEAKVARSLQLLMRLPMVLADMPVGLKETEYEGAKLYTVDLTESVPQAALLGAAVQPGYTVHNGFLIFGLSPDALKFAIDRMKSSTDDIRQNEDFMRYFSRMPSDKAITNLNYTNIRNGFETVYGLLISLVFMPPISGYTEGIPVDMALLPTAESVGQHLYGSLSYTWSEPSGEITEGYGPFGAEILPGAAAVLAGLTGVAIAESITAASQGAESAAELMVITEINTIQTALMVYQLENGKLPEKLEALIAPTEGYPQGYLSRPDLPSDPWGQAYNYEMLGRSEYRIWSNGPNTVDDGGQGDDIVVVR